MKRIISLIICLLLLSITSCARQTGEAVGEVSIHQGAFEEFSSLDEFEQAVLTPSLIDSANLSSLVYFYVPVGISERYPLNRITVDQEVIAFWYLSDQGEENIVFLCARHDHTPRRGFEQEDGLQTWMCDGDSLALYMPKGLITENTEQLKYTDRYIKTESGEMSVYINHPVEFISSPSTYTITEKLELTLLGVSSGDTGVNISLHNGESVTYAYGYDYEFEVLRNGTWYTTDYGPIDVPALGWLISPGETVQHTFYVSGDRAFSNGTYRVVLEVFPAETQDESFYIALQFCIE